MKSPWHFIEGDPLELIEDLKRYTSEVQEEMKKKQYSLSRKAHRRLKRDSPFRPVHEDKHYRDGWRVSREYTGHGADQKLVIHNRSKPGLTHLLEHGHLNADGTRTKAYPHIAPVQEELNEAWEKAVIEILERSGKK